MVIGSRQRIATLAGNISLSVNGLTLQQVESTKCLGLTIDQFLSWRNHLQSVRQKVGCGIRIAKRMVLFSYTALKTWTHWVGYLNEVQLWQWLRRSLDLQISSLVGSLKETNAFLVHLICAIETVTIKGVYIIINIIFLLRKRVVFNRCLAA